MMNQGDLIESPLTLRKLMIRKKIPPETFLNRPFSKLIGGFKLLDFSLMQIKKIVLKVTVIAIFQNVSYDEFLRRGIHRSQEI